MENKPAIAQWSESAPYWEKYRPVIVEMFAPVSQALVEDAGIARGNSVLDVATGPGEPALTIAELVGPEGTVVGTDGAPEMIAIARREAAKRGLGNARFEAVASGEQNAASMPFADNTFDAVVSRFGVMFFPAPLESLREMLRVLKPGGRMALAVWSLQEKNPFDTMVSRIVDRYLDRYVGADAPKPAVSEMFRFAKPGDLRSLLARGGAVSTSERLFQFAIRAAVSAEEFWTLRTEMSEKLRTKIGMLAEAPRAELKREAVEVIRGCAVAGGINIPAEVLIVSGRK